MPEQYTHPEWAAGTIVVHWDGDRGEVVDLDEWDEDNPFDDGPRTRVMWESGIREWVATEDLTVAEAQR